MAASGWVAMGGCRTASYGTEELPILRLLLKRGRRGATAVGLESTATIRRYFAVDSLQKQPAAITHSSYGCSVVRVTVLIEEARARGEG